MSEELPSAPASREAWFGLIAISLGVSLVVIDFTIVNVIMPPIVSDLGSSSSDAQWIQESYAIVLAALLLLMGRVADVHGARRLFLIGSVVFAVASVAAALSPEVGWLIASRTAQGVAGAMIMPSSLALVSSSFHGPDRGKAFAIWGSTIGAAAAVGPLLGGWLGEYSWRWAFGINIVVIALILLGVRRFVAQGPVASGRVDAVGGVLSVLGLGFLAFALIEGRTAGWWEALGAGPAGIRVGPLSVVPVALLLAAVSLAAFASRQVRITRAGGEALVSTDLFASRSFSSGNLSSLLIGLAEFGILAVLPLWLQFVLGYSTLQTGLIIATVAVGSFVASGASFGMAAKTSAVALVRLGLVLEIVGLFVFAVLARSDSGWLFISVALLVYGVGVGFATAHVTNVVLADVPPSKAGQGSGVQTAARQLGSALGIAVLTTTFYTAFAEDLSHRLRRAGDAHPERAAGAVADSAGAAISRLEGNPATEPVAAAAREAMTHAVQVNGYLCAVLLLIGLASTLLIPKGGPPR